MLRMKQLLLIGLFGALAMVPSTTAFASHPGSGTPDLGRSCERASSQGLSSPAHAHCASDIVIDLDGIATTGPGGESDQEVFAGAIITLWPAEGIEGVDWFDNDADGLWTFGPGGDDIHLEDPRGACLTAVRDSQHNTGLDCVVLDVDGSLTDGQQVDCDLEEAANFTGIPNCPAPNVGFFDANGNLRYDNGEDIVFDANGNGVFD